MPSLPELFTLWKQDIKHIQCRSYSTSSMDTDMIGVRGMVHSKAISSALQYIVAGMVPGGGCMTYQVHAPSMNIQGTWYDVCSRLLVYAFSRRISHSFIIGSCRECCFPFDLHNPIGRQGKQEDSPKQATTTTSATALATNKWMWCPSCNHLQRRSSVVRSTTVP